MDKNKMLLVGAIWIAISLAGFGVFKAIISPMMAEKKAKQVDEEKKQVLANTSSSSRYQNHVRIGVDSFSGYGILRSDEIQRHAGTTSIQVEVVDIPDYKQRLASLKSGDIQMAAFSVDALIKTSAEAGDLPGTIVAVIDESYGADSMWGSKQFTSLDSLNDPSTKFVLVGDSPSETFVHVVRHFFDLNRIGPDPFVRVGSAKEVIQAYRQSRPGEKKIFVTWQPEASQIAANADYVSFMDSSRLRGYIMDVLVVSRDFLVKNEDVASDMVWAYFQANFDLSDKVSLVMKDTARVGEPITLDRAKSVASGIRWRNTQENYAHFGLAQQPGYLHMEDIINNVTRILVQSGSIKADPTGGKPNLLYYDKVMRRLFDSNFHPGSKSEGVQAEAQIPALSDEQWKSLTPIGTMQVPPLTFARGTARLSLGSEEILADLAEKLKTWPQYYIRVRGHAKGTTPADLEAQKRRSEAAVEWLVNHGVNRNRIRSEASESNGSTTVKFSLGQLPY